MRLDDFVTLLAARRESPGAGRIAAVIDAVRAVQARAHFDDDVSLLELVID
jgi:hypothetical protein